MNMSSTICLHCNKLTLNPKFCNNSCSAKHNNGLRKSRTLESKLKTSNSIKSNYLYTKITLCIDCNKFFPHSRVPSMAPTRCKLCLKLFKAGVMKALSISNSFGGHNSKKKIWFKKNDGETVYLQSSYEKRFAEILEELNIPWTRPEPLRWIDDQGTSHRYYPDFKIQNIYIDTKNSYLAVKDAVKIETVRRQNNIDLRVVLDENITKEFIGSLI